MKFAILFLSGYFTFLLAAQNELPDELTTNEVVFRDNVADARMLYRGLQPSYPFIELGRPNEFLLLQFDELDVDSAGNFTYRIVHCNADWSVSGLPVNEFVDGFQEAEIDDWRFSNGTRQDYVRYTVAIPNQLTQLTRSGNYAIYVYENADESDPVLLLRFVVYERLLEIDRSFNSAMLDRYWFRRQSLNFSIDTEPFGVAFDPSADLTATVLLNGRWDVAATDLRPNLIRPQRIDYRHTDQTIFRGATEFRTVDVRRLNEDRVEPGQYRWHNGLHQITLPTDEPFYHSSRDVNRQMGGRYFTDNLDRRLLAANPDYVLTHFSLKPTEMDDSIRTADIYLFGKMTNWRTDDEQFKMNWNEKRQQFELSVYLKQGVYNYQYLFVNKAGDDQEPTLQSLEGNYWTPINDYALFIYYRPFGSRADRIIGAEILQANP